LQQIFYLYSARKCRFFVQKKCSSGLL
jgi:hypothetical protein